MSFYGLKCNFVQMMEMCVDVCVCRHVYTITHMYTCTEIPYHQIPADASQEKLRGRSLRHVSKGVCVCLCVFKECVFRVADCRQV